MQRREFITLIGGAAICPIAAHAQQAGQMKRIGVLMGFADDDEGQSRLAAMLKGLKELGWTEGHNFQVETRWSTGDKDKIEAYVTELVALSPDLILVTSTAVFAATQRATRSIPIVFVQVVDPVNSGLVASLAQPGGNSTGFASFEYAIAGKWLAIVKEIAPSVRRVSVVHHPDDPAAPGYLRESEVLAGSLDVRLVPIGARTIAEVERGMNEFAREPNGGVTVLPSAFTAVHHERIIALAALQRLPAAYPFRYFATAGGLSSYGFDTIELYTRAASYVDRILRGAKPNDLPIQQPTKFELIVNLKTAKALGLTIPESFLVRADEVIE